MHGTASAEQNSATLHLAVTKRRIPGVAPTTFQGRNGCVRRQYQCVLRWTVHLSAPDIRQSRCPNMTAHVNRPTQWRQSPRTDTKRRHIWILPDLLIMVHSVRKAMLLLKGHVQRLHTLVATLMRHIHVPDSIYDTVPCIRHGRWQSSAQAIQARIISMAGQQTLSNCQPVSTPALGYRVQ